MKGTCNVVLSNDGDVAIIDSAQWNDRIRIERSDLSRDEFLKRLAVGEEVEFEIDRLPDEAGSA